MLRLFAISVAVSALYSLSLSLFPPLCIVYGIVRLCMARCVR